MIQEIYLITYVVGEYSDKGDYNYKAFRSLEKAGQVCSGLEEFCKWYSKVDSNLSGSLRLWREDYTLNNPRPPNPPPRVKKSSTEEYCSMSEKEWVQVLKKQQEAAEPFHEAINHWSDGFVDAEDEMKRIWWSNNFLTLPPELVEFKDFRDGARAHSIAVERIDLYGDDPSEPI